MYKSFMYLRLRVGVLYVLFLLQIRLPITLLIGPGIGEKPVEWPEAYKEATIGRAIESLEEALSGFGTTILWLELLSKMAIMVRTGYTSKYLTDKKTQRTQEAK